MRQLVRWSVLAGVLIGAATANARDFHVALDGNDMAPGSKDAPFATLERARDAARIVREAEPDTPIRIVIGAGRRVLARPLVLRPVDSGVEYTAAPGQKAVISGGRVITGWRNVRDNLWTVALPDVKAGRWYFRQLFADGKRLTRARTPNKGFFTTAGVLTKYKNKSKKRYGGYGGIGKLRRNNPDAFCGFQFSEGDIKAWPDYSDAEVITYHSWECSWQTIRRIDMEKRDLHFNTPCRYPIGFFSPHARYRIENLRSALDVPGEWKLCRKTGLLSYLARPGENPGKMEFIAPAIEKLVVANGEGGKPVKNLKFTGLSFQHTKYPMGIYDVAKDWPKPAKKVFPGWPTTFNPGYTDAQAAPRCGQALEFTGAQEVVFRECEFAHLGAAAIKFGLRCRKNLVDRCTLTDLGGCGILIGNERRSVGPGKLERRDTASQHTVRDCRILNGSIVHPSAVAIWIAQSHHNRILHNEIAGWGYSGISLGWTWGRSPNFSDNNLIANNHIHHVLQALADGGGIYTLGILKGCVLRENYIHDIQRPKGAIGSHNNGMFFDQGSQFVRVERNVIRNIGHHPVRHNKNAHGDHTWVDNDFSKGNEPPKNAAARQVVKKAGPRPR